MEEAGRWGGQRVEGERLGGGVYHDVVNNIKSVSRVKIVLK